MTDGIGLGLVVNILFWTLAVLVAVGLGSLAVIEYFPGRENKELKGVHGGRGAATAADSRVEPDESGERYRKAS
jgi:hypothetical protein